jgi:hypothetical protein
MMGGGAGVGVRSFFSTSSLSSFSSANGSADERASGGYMESLLVVGMATGRPPLFGGKRSCLHCPRPSRETDFVSGQEFQGMCLRGLRPLIRDKKRYYCHRHQIQRHQSRRCHAYHHCRPCWKHNNDNPKLRAKRSLNIKGGCRGNPVQNKFLAFRS